MLLENETVLVTGASRGIGQSIAMQMGKEGAFVIGTATTEEGSERITKYFEQMGIKGQGMQLNVTDPDRIAVVVNEINKKFGVITVLVNNAGITRDNLLLRMKDDDWNDIISTNLTSIFSMTRACLRGMVKNRHGRIINIASVVGMMGAAGQSNYSAAKAGMVGFGKSLAKEVGSRNITVNTIAPGFINTDMTDNLPEKQKAEWIKNIALARMGEAVEVADTAVFLASCKANYITGHTLHVNGGLYMG